MVPPCWEEVWDQIHASSWRLSLWPWDGNYNLLFCVFVWGEFWWYPVTKKWHHMSPMRSILGIFCFFIAFVAEQMVPILFFICSSFPGLNVTFLTKESLLAMELKRPCHLETLLSLSNQDNMSLSCFCLLWFSLPTFYQMGFFKKPLSRRPPKLISCCFDENNM